MDQFIDSYTKEIITAGPQSVSRCKELISNVAHLNINAPETKDYVSKTIAAVRVSPEGQAGIGAFLSKGKAPWIPKQNK
jgi:methylglutaconyl-CoA hydratase